MSDDWRLRIDLHEEGRAHELTERLEASNLERDLESSFHDRVAVSRDGATVFIYTGEREQAEQAAQLIGSLATENGWHTDTELRRWHPTAEEWEDADVPLPATDEEQAKEHAEYIRRERAESEAKGHPEYEVRVHCPSRSDAEALAEAFRSQGWPTVHRWHYVLIGAPDEDSAAALAEQVKGAAPPNSTITTEATAQAVRDGQPPNPYAIFGGLGG